MKTIEAVTLCAFITVGATFTITSYAGGGLTGEPKVKIPPDLSSVDEAKLSTELCGPGWKISSAGGPLSQANFICVPVKPKVQCPANTDLVETDCSIGCRVKPK